MYQLIGAALAIVLIFGAGYGLGRTDGQAVEVAKQMSAIRSREETLSQVAEAVSKMQVVNKTIHARVERETIEKPVYRECVHTDDGLRYVNEALTGNAGSTDDRGVPSPDPIG